MFMMELGIKGSQSETVTEARTARAVGSGSLPVYATPAMAALMEKTCLDSVAPALEQGRTTVGISLSLRHLSATPVGMRVRCESELTEVDRRRLVFSVKVFDEAGLIGEGIHERFIVEAEAFAQKARRKQASV